MLGSPTKFKQTNATFYDNDYLVMPSHMGGEVRIPLINQKGESSHSLMTVQTGSQTKLISNLAEASIVEE